MFVCVLGLLGCIVGYFVLVRLADAPIFVLLTSTTPMICVTQGGPLPESVLTELVVSRLAQLDCQTEGWVLTGYPRTASHAAVR
jgi:hypothetical protein